MVLLGTEGLILFSLCRIFLFLCIKIGGYIILFISYREEITEYRIVKLFLKLY